MASHIGGRYQVCFAGKKRIQAITGLSRTTFQKNIEKLFQLKLLSKSKDDSPLRKLAITAQKSNIPNIQNLVKKLSPPSYFDKNAIYLTHKFEEGKKFLQIPTSLFNAIKSNYLPHSTYLVCIYLISKSNPKWHTNEFRFKQLNRRFLAEKLQVALSTIQLAVKTLSTFPLLSLRKIPQILRKARNEFFEIIFVFQNHYSFQFLIPPPPS